MKLKNKIVSLCIIFLCINCVNGFSQTVTPKYKVLIDESGFNTDTYQDQLKEKAAQLSAILPAIYKDSFMVLSAGFYLNHFNIKSGISEQLEYLKTKAAQTSKYYLLYAKQTDSSGIYTRFYIDMKLPKSGVFSCMDDAQRNVLLSKIETALNASYNTNKRSFLKYNLAEMAGMEALKIGITKATKCCGDNTFDCTFNEDEITETLYAEGFSEILDQKIFRLAPVTNPNPNFETQYNLTFLNEEDTTKTYNYTTKLKEILTQYAADGTVKAKLSYYNNSNATTFKDFKPLKLDTRIFITEIVVVNLKGKNRVFVYLERNHSTNSTRGVVDFKNMEVFVEKNMDICRSTTLRKRVNVDTYAIDGHYSTVYLVATLMGTEDAFAFEMAREAENFDHYIDPITRDVTIHGSSWLPFNPYTNEGGIFSASPDDDPIFIIKAGGGSWADRYYQIKWHGLTNGPQKEVLDDALNEIYVNKDLKFLHKVGDAYAHIRNKDEKNPSKWTMYGKPVEVHYDAAPMSGVYHSGTWTIDYDYTIEHAFADTPEGKTADNIAYNYDIYKIYCTKLIEIFNNSEFKYSNKVKKNNPDLSVFQYFENGKYEIFKPSIYLPTIEDRLFMYEARIRMHQETSNFKKIVDMSYRQYLIITGYFEKIGIDFLSGTEGVAKDFDKKTFDERIKYLKLTTPNTFFRVTITTDPVLMKSKLKSTF